jgi:hypothetical protein
MKRLSIKYLLITGIVALLVPLAYYSLRHFMRPKPTPLSEEQRLKEKASRVEYWASQATVSLASQDLERAVSDLMQARPCLSVPAIGQAISLNKLNDQQKGDLKDAITMMLKAYGKNDPDAVFDYMAGRKESLSPQALQNAKLDLSMKLRMTPSAVASLSHRRVFSLLWTKDFKCQSHWQSLIDKSGCVSLWQAKQSLNDEAISSLGKEDNDVFLNIVRTNHWFSPISRTLDSVLADEKIVTYADVKFVIQYDAGRLHEPRPHYVRFWYEPTDGVWHPLDFVQVPAVDGTYPSILF